MRWQQLNVMDLQYIIHIPLQYVQRRVEIWIFDSFLLNLPYFQYLHRSSFVSMSGDGVRNKYVLIKKNYMETTTHYKKGKGLKYLERYY